MMIQENVTPRTTQERQQIVRVNHAWLATEDRITVTCDAALILLASYGYCPFPGELSAQNEVSFGKPKKARIP
jgi:hypothetical protein